MRALLERVALGIVASKDRWVANGYPAYPLWIPVVIHGFAAIAALLTTLQRPADQMVPVLALVCLVLSPWLVELRGQVAPATVYLLLAGGGSVAVIVHYPVDYDITPLLLVIMVGHIGATMPLLRSGLATAVAALIVVALAFAGALPVGAAGLWIAALIGGWDVGFILRFQQLSLETGQRDHAERERIAVLEERRRIARDVHDLVAHSLSVTMLHLTAARRDLEDDGEVTDVVAALQDAERIGRQAMSDIRGVVGLLGTAGDQTPGSEPSLRDLPALIDDFRSAGLDVHAAIEGEAEQLPATVALALYRIVQESLANVAKHAPGSRALVRVDLRGAMGLLTIRNAVPRGFGRDLGGSGLRGMSERADQIGARFTAGVEDRLWTVRVMLPREGAAACPLSSPLWPLPGLATIREVVTK